MINWIGNYFLSLLIALLLAGLIIPKVTAIAFSKKLFDEMDERKVHKGVVPRLGGVSFMPAIMFSFCIVVGYTIGTGATGLEVTLESIVPIFFLFCAMLLMYLIGIADDMVGVRYSFKFIFQIVAGTLIVTSGLWVRDLYGFLWIHDWPAWLGWIMTIFLTLYVINAINLIDGIDGLASGLSMIAFAFYGFVLIRTGQYLYGILAGAAIGTLIPFFYYNVFGRAERRTKIFMGDAGSLTIGTLLLFLTVAVFNIPPGSVGHDNIFILAIAPIMLPCFDVVRVFFHRIKRGSNPFLPDKCHIHHKLLALGFPQWKALVTILAFDAALIGINLLLCDLIGPTWLLIGDVAVWSLLNVWLTALIRKRETRLHSKLYD